MNTALSLKQIYDVQDDINSMCSLLGQLENQVHTVRQLINKKKEFLINYCNHNKQIDTRSCSEHTEFYCTICGMYL